MGTIWSEFFNSYRRTGGFVFTFLGFLAGVWSVFYAAPFTLDGRWILGLICISYIIIAPLVDLSVRSLSAAKLAEDSVLPKVILAKNGPEGLLLLLSPSKFFGGDSIVSIYQEDDGFEIFLGWGRVQTIKQNGTIQVRDISQVYRPETWEKISKSEKTALDSLVTKPDVPYQVMQVQGV